MYEDSEKPPKVDSLKFIELPAVFDIPQRRYLAVNGLSVIDELEKHDGKWWRHVSIAHQNRLPTWEEYKEVKAKFIGKNKKAIQILPNEKEYINKHPYCLHMFHCPEGDGLPDFVRFGGL